MSADCSNVLLITFVNLSNVYFNININSHYIFVVDVVVRKRNALVKKIIKKILPENQVEIE